MEDPRAIIAIGRVEQALGRIERAIAAGERRLQRLSGRHRALRAAAEAALADVDRLLGEAG